jgi:hypothetical protein
MLALPQLEKRYGLDAETMLLQPATKVFFKTSEARAAQWISETIGQIEVERLRESRSMGLLGSKKCNAIKIAVKPLIMASEVSGLEPLHEFIKQENQVVPVHFQLAKKRENQPEFMARKPPAIVPGPVLEAPAAPAPAELAQKPPQAVPPLFDLPPASSKGAYVRISRNRYVASILSSFNW